MGERQNWGKTPVLLTQAAILRIQLPNSGLTLQTTSTQQYSLADTSKNR
jgi:hypothetical protein